MGVLPESNGLTSPVVRGVSEGGQDPEKLDRADAKSQPPPFIPGAGGMTRITRIALKRIKSIACYLTAVPMVVISHSGDEPGGRS